MADMNLTSTAFQSGERIPVRYTCSGENVSPPLQWGRLPDGTKSMALIMDDPDAPNGLFVHWVLYNLSTEVDHLPEDYRLGSGVYPGRNNFGQARYGGPCPPLGTTHHYYFRLYALEVKLDLAAGATRAQVIDAMHGHILAETELMGLFGR